MLAASFSFSLRLFCHLAFQPKTYWNDQPCRAAFDQQGALWSHLSGCIGMFDVEIRSHDELFLQDPYLNISYLWLNFHLLSDRF